MTNEGEHTRMTWGESGLDPRSEAYRDDGEEGRHMVMTEGVAYWDYGKGREYGWDDRAVVRWGG